MSDADVSEVRESASCSGEVEETTADLRGLLDFLCGLRMADGGDEQDGPQRAFRIRWWTSWWQNPDRARTGCLPAAGEVDDVNPGNLDELGVDFAQKFGAMSQMAIAERESFLHWEVAFPGCVAAMAGHPTGWRIRRGDRQSAVGQDQAPGG